MQPIMRRVANAGSLIMLWMLVSISATTAESGTSASGSQTAKKHAVKVLFVGNSHLLVKNVPAQVRQRLLARYADVQTRMMAVGGASLSYFVGRADVVKALTRTNWDVVVLQEASASFLSPLGRRSFHKSVSWFLERIAVKTRVILYQTWPWRTGSHYYGGRQFDEDSMWSIMRLEYGRISQHRRISLAPVGQCWVQSPRKQAFYSSDGNHASTAGARFAARIIANTITDSRQKGC